MKMILTLLLAATIGPLAATPKPKPDFVNKPALLVVEVCGRGCYQYVLKLPKPAPNAVLYPTNLSDDMQQQALNFGMNNPAGLPVLFSGKLMKQKTQVKKPGAADVPEAHYQAQNVQITAIKRQ
ncbi:hypothetical protein J2I47_20020 [Fibrella sp. HMF5335]|uniref:Uncharacterized protein n=1 Tax=Fibrella rubiginis TaxID=2817060 RepID=A0A939GL73_9BACT|nr:hypothetical protein [Fibrella rubiginis]MBO0938850.1 hypothetical protein [Fibrella rubiginis]